MSILVFSVTEKGHAQADETKSYLDNLDAYYKTYDVSHLTRAQRWAVNKMVATPSTTLRPAISRILRAVVLPE